MNEVEEQGEFYFQSREVNAQRLKDMAEFVKVSLPELLEQKTAEGEQVKLKKSDLMLVLQELDREFSEDNQLAAISALIGERLERVLCGKVASRVENLASRAEEEYPEVAIGIRASIVWDSVMPNFSSTLEHIRRISAVAVNASLSLGYWENPQFGTISGDLLEALCEDYDYLFGMYGLQILIIYIKVFDMEQTPEINLHVRRWDDDDDGHFV